MNRPESTDNRTKRARTLRVDEAFTKSEAEKLLDLPPTMMEFIMDKANEVFIDNLPVESITQLGKKMTYLIGFLFYTFSLVVFINFFITGDLIYC